MSVLRFILFTHTQIYSPRFTRFSLSFSVCLSLLQANLTREIKANILVESARALSFSLSLQIISLSKHGCAQAAAWAQLTLIVFYRRRRSLLVTQMAVAVGALAKNYNHN